MIAEAAIAAYVLYATGLGIRLLLTLYRSLSPERSLPIPKVIEYKVQGDDIAGLI